MSHPAIFRTRAFPPVILIAGLAIGYDRPLGAGDSRYSIGGSLTYEYDFTDKETSISLDVVLGWSF